MSEEYKKVRTQSMTSNMILVWVTKYRDRKLFVRHVSNMCFGAGNEQNGPIFDRSQFSADPAEFPNLRKLNWERDRLPLCVNKESE